MSLLESTSSFVPTSAAATASHAAAARAAGAERPFIRALRCKECGTEYPTSEARTVCEEDFAPLEIAYDYDAMVASGRVTRASIAAGPPSLWRYRDLLPIDGAPQAGLRSGWTPLVRADRLAKALGVDELWLKDDSASNPTLSYKDRVVSVALTKAVELGFDTLGCASTGNLAHAVAAHAATAGLKAYVVVPHDIEAGKIAAARVFGANVIRVRGSYDDVNRLCTEIADRFRWALVNVNLRPFYTEGAKTHGFEVAEQLGWRFPKHHVLPVAGGTILPKVWKAYEELGRLGLVGDEKPRMYGAQAAGCDPISAAIREGASMFRPQKPKTIAKSIAIGNPADGYYVLDVIRRSGGWADSASDPEILEAIELLARTEGIFAEPAGGTTLAVAKKLIASGRIPRDEPICVSITGNGLKTIEALEGRGEELAVIEPRIEAFAALVGG
ncbi:MAG: threonine synthase [Myxococcota bacterium]